MFVYKIPLYLTHNLAFTSSRSSPRRHLPSSINFRCATEYAAWLIIQPHPSKALKIKMLIMLSDDNVWLTGTQQTACRYYITTQRHANKLGRTSNKEY